MKAKKFISSGHFLLVTRYSLPFTFYLQIRRLFSFIFFFTIFSAQLSCCPHCGKQSQSINDGSAVIPGAYQTEVYFPILEDKRIAVVGNHTSTVGDTHLVDTLLSSGFNVVRIFSPEHGFRGTAADGEYIDDGKDKNTGLPVISLYGENRRPQPQYIEDLDLIIFDIQDVGVRFYTYISTMTYVIEEAAKKGLPVMILDRPNPNGHYVDGPVLEPEFSSFVGLHPVPVVHGMTVGEYALMVNGEGWLKDELYADIEVIKVANYCHSTPYEVCVSPSPNLPNMTAIYLYPSLCFFEGTQISVGRGTEKPFQVFGHPELPTEKYSYLFTPKSISASPNPPQLNRNCFGKDLSKTNPDSIRAKGFIDLTYLIDAYKNFPDKDTFFNNYFERLAGTGKLRKQIIKGIAIEEIRQSWEKDIESFKKIRKKYLLYNDFE